MKKTSIILVFILLSVNITSAQQVGTIDIKLSKPLSYFLRSMYVELYGDYKSDSPVEAHVININSYTDKISAAFTIDREDSRLTEPNIRLRHRLIAGDKKFPLSKFIKCIDGTSIGQCSQTNKCNDKGILVPDATCGASTTYKMLWCVDKSSIQSSPCTYDIFSFQWKCFCAEGQVELSRECSSEIFGTCRKYQINCFTSSSSRPTSCSKNPSCASDETFLGLPEDCTNRPSGVVDSGKTPMAYCDQQCTNYDGCTCPESLNCNRFNFDIRKGDACGGYSPYWFSDEFTNNFRSKWTFNSQNSFILSQRTGYNRLNTDETDLNNQLTAPYMVIDAPANDFEAEVKLHGPLNWKHSGILLYQDTNNFLIWGLDSFGEIDSLLLKGKGIENPIATASVNKYLELWLKIEKTSSGYNFYSKQSESGDYVQISPLININFNPLKIGLTSWNREGNTAQHMNTYVDFDYFRVTSTLNDGIRSTPLSCSDTCTDPDGCACPKGCKSVQINIGDKCS